MSELFNRFLSAIWILSFFYFIIPWRYIRCCACVRLKHASHTRKTVQPLILNGKRHISIIINMLFLLTSFIFISDTNKNSINHECIYDIKRRVITLKHKFPNTYNFLCITVCTHFYGNVGGNVVWQAIRDCFFFVIDDDFRQKSPEKELMIIGIKSSIFCVGGVWSLHIFFFTFRLIQHVYKYM